MIDNSEGATRRAMLALGAAGVAGAPMAALAAAPAGRVVPGVEFVYEAIADLGPAQNLGQTPQGMRRQIPVLGGSFEGPRIKGKIHAGAVDYQLVRTDGFTQISAVYTIETDDGVLIHVNNHGVIRAIDKPPPEGYGRTQPEFEAPNGKYGWLNEAVFIGTLGRGPGPGSQVRIGIFKVI